jgi:hypothetical protein
MTDDKSPEKTLKKIRSGFLDRSLSLTKIAVQSSAHVAMSGIKGAFQDKEGRDRQLKGLWNVQAKLLTHELGRLKGSLMKVGQMLALYGEHFLPEEVVAQLKVLNDQSVSVEWNTIKRILESRMDAERLAELEIDPSPLAAASMGQVPGQGSGASITATASSACSPWRALVEVAGVGVAHAFVGGLLMMLGSRIAGGKAAPRGHSCRQSCSRLLAVVQWSRRLHKRPWPQRYGYPGHQLLHRRACPVRLWPAVPLDVLIWLNDRSLLRFAGGMAVRPFLP